MQRPKERKDLNAAFTALANDLKARKITRDEFRRRVIKMILESQRQVKLGLQQPAHEQERDR